MITGKGWNLQMRNGLKFLNIVKKKIIFKLSFSKKGIEILKKQKFQLGKASGGRNIF